MTFINKEKNIGAVIVSGFTAVVLKKEKNGTEKFMAKTWLLDIFWAVTLH